MAFWVSFGNALIANWVNLMVRALYQGSLAILLVWVIARLFPGIHPVVRFWLWRLAYLKLLVTFLWAKPIELYFQYGFKELLVRWATQAGLHHHSHPIVMRIPTFGIDPSTFILRSGTKILFIIWLIGLIWFTASLISLGRKQRLVDNSNSPIGNPSLLLIYHGLGARSGLKKMPHLFVSERIHSPLLQGLVNPKIIIPASILATYREAEIQLILAHELAHYRRGDLFWNWLPTIVRTIFFFHPLVWIIRNEWTRVQEICCDHKAVQWTQARHSDYGRVLLRASIRSILNPINNVATFYNSQSKQTLKKRLEALNDTHSLSPKSMILTGLILLTLGIASIIPWRLTEAKSLPVNLWINYLTLEKKFEIAAHVILPEKDIVKMDLQIDDKTLTTYPISSNICFGYAKPTENCFPKKGPHKVTLKVLTTTRMVEEQNWVYFQDRMNWSNRLGSQNDRTVLKLGPFVCVFNN
jgi:beta-lactamase regulating signal transducer with metallopeptidase domain